MCSALLWSTGQWWCDVSLSGWCNRWRESEEEERKLMIHKTSILNQVVRYEIEAVWINRTREIYRWKEEIHIWTAYTHSLTLTVTIKCNTLLRQSRWCNGRRKYRLDPHLMQLFEYIHTPATCTVVRVESCEGERRMWRWDAVNAVCDVTFHPHSSRMHLWLWCCMKRTFLPTSVLRWIMFHPHTMHT